MTAQSATSNNGLAIDRAEAERFLDLIGRGEVCFTFQTLDDSKSRAGRRAPRRNKVRERQGKKPLWIRSSRPPRHPRRLLRGACALEQRRRRHLRRRQRDRLRGRSKAKNIVKVRALFVDRSMDQSAADGGA